MSLRLARHALVVLALAGTPSFADRIHLTGGGTIDVDSWTIEGDAIVYESDDGWIGLPRSIVVRIEPGPGPGPGGAVDATPVPAAARPATEDAVPVEVDPVAAARPGTIRVTHEIAETMHAARGALDARDFRAAADLYGEALRDGPDELQPARVGFALAQMALGEDALASGAVLDGLAREPRHPELLELLGDLRDREERVEDALRAWREALAARGSDSHDRLERKIERAVRELDAGRDYALSASSHFTLRHDGGVDRALTRAVLDHLEQAFWRVSRELDHTPRQPITVLLYPEREFHEVTGAEEWVGGLYDGKIRVPLGGLRRLGDAARRVLTHELTHAVLHSKTRGNCPRWLHEGLAQRAEGRRLAPHERDGVAAMLAKLQTGGRSSEALSYPAALSLTEFIVSYWGETALLRLLARLGDGIELDRALADAYGENEVSLRRRWAQAVLDAEER